MRLLVIVLLVILVSTRGFFLRSALSRPRAKINHMMYADVDCLVTSFMSSRIAPSSVVLAEQKIYIESYETSGIPPVFLILSLGLVAGFAAIPAISRKRQVQRNSRSIDETDFYDKVFEEKLTNREKLNDTYEEKGSVSRYTKD